MKQEVQSKAEEKLRAAIDALFSDNAVNMANADLIAIAEQMQFAPRFAAVKKKMARLLARHGFSNIKVSKSGRGSSFVWRDGDSYAIYRLSTGGSVITKRVCLY